MAHQRSKLDEILDQKFKEYRRETAKMRENATMKTRKNIVESDTVGKALDNELKEIRKEAKKYAGMAYVFGQIR